MEMACIAPSETSSLREYAWYPSANTNTTAASEGSIGTGLGALPSSRGDPGRAGEGRESREW